ncbi:Zinc finger protein 42 [Knufia peltigerae]|uniref:Zinc finger protein 42 n=1 Tax=Knufia peltigerae TaxID=1002370 RepID=A0AA38Y671_9EURO|nr:Zinc finger protein 42 [Knufia peltigerae]
MASNNGAGERHYCEALGCNRSFKNKNSLKTHINGVHQEGYPCQRCGRDLKDPSNLKRHGPKCPRASPEEKAKATLYNCAWPSCRYEGRKDNVVRHQKTCKLQPEGNDAKPAPLKMSKEWKEQAELGLLSATIEENGAEEDLLAQQEAPVPQFEVQDLNGAYQAQVEEAPETSLDNAFLETTGTQFQCQAYDNVASGLALSTSERNVSTPGSRENVAFPGHNNNYVPPAGQCNIGTANIFPAQADYNNVALPAVGNDFQGHVTYNYNAASDMAVSSSGAAVSTLGGMENVAFPGHNDYVLGAGQCNIGTANIFPAQAGFDNTILPAAANDFQGYVEYNYNPVPGAGFLVSENELPSLAPNPELYVPYETYMNFGMDFAFNT